MEKTEAKRSSAEAAAAAQAMAAAEWERARSGESGAENDAEASADAAKLAGKTFVITGSLNRYASRNELKDIIEGMGGKVAGSVSAKTDYLITNNPGSGSSKNRAARELGIEIITEDQVRVMLGHQD